MPVSLNNTLTTRARPAGDSNRYDNGDVRKTVVGSIVGVLSAAGLGTAMLPLRAHLSLATAALVLVVPVVGAAVVGGLGAGVASAVAGFLVYDFVFVPPYYTLNVGAAQNWVALSVYAVVVLLVARVVAHLESARADAQMRAVETQRLYELSELFVKDRSLEDLLETVVTTVRTVFAVPGVALFLPVKGRLAIAASAGEAMSPQQLHPLDPESGIPVSVGTSGPNPDRLQTVALSALDRPIGVLAVLGLPTSVADRSLLRAFANHAAVAVERAQLREQALRSELLEEVDRLRRSLLGAVSHDLRTPLASMKVASTTLLDRTLYLSMADTDELHGLIDVQTDRLTRLVSSLLDMTRFQAGVLEIHRQAWSVLDLVGETVAGLRPALAGRPVEVDIPDWLPAVEVDHLLVGQVIANLLENAHRHAPPHSPVTVAAEVRRDEVVVSVTDEGPGVPPQEREAIFNSFVRFDTGGRSGLGLAIAETFVKAHGERIWVEDAPGGGARFVFTLALAPTNGAGR
jgi:two-component system, OmpR family, sensor histidine kinase KdpD